MLTTTARRLLLPLAGVVLTLTSCGTEEVDRVIPPGSGTTQSGNIPPAINEQADAEMSNHARVDVRHGCSVRTTAQLLDAQERRQQRTGAPIESWLVDAPPDSRVYVCRYQVTRTENDGRARSIPSQVLIPDNVPGAPMIGLDFNVS